MDTADPKRHDGVLANYVRELRIAPPPLQREQKILLGIIFVAVAASRILALSSSPLDWDEALFACGVRAYDVVPHHPHPPGYPLFILVAKIVRLVLRDDFRSLQAVAAIASLMLFPAAFALCRELRLRFRVCLAAASITVFMPTVWYYGGTALSDVPALFLVVTSSALLLAGGRNPRSWLAGMFVLGLTAGVRPQHVLIAAIPALFGAMALRQLRVLVAGCAVFAAVVLATYGAAAFASSDPPFGYWREVTGTAEFIRKTDSFRNSGRTPLGKLVPVFFIHSHRGGRGGEALLILTVAGLVAAAIRKRVPIGIVVAMFVPTAVMNWLMLDTTAVTRYGIAYVMLFTIVAAEAVDVLVSLAGSALIQNAVMTTVAAALVIALIRWTWPALELVHHEISPPIAAMQWVQTHVPRVGPHLYLDDDLGYHAGYQLPGYDIRFFRDYRQIPDSEYVPGNYCMVNRMTVQPHARVFRFPRRRLADIARQSYFEVSLIPMDTMVRFGDGWYQEEYDDSHSWRWMGRESTTLFPPLGGKGVLRLRLHLPLDTLAAPPVMTLTWNGTVVARTLCTTADVESEYLLPSSANRPDELRISVDRASHPIERGLTSDPREFGVLLSGVSWERADGVKSGS